MERDWYVVLAVPGYESEIVSTHARRHDAKRAALAEVEWRNYRRSPLATITVEHRGATVETLTGGIAPDQDAVALADVERQREAERMIAEGLQEWRRPFPH